MPLNNATSYIKSATGTYAGNGSVNRAIPHGLPGVPYLVFIVNTTNGSAYLHWITGGSLWCAVVGTAAVYAVTTPDLTSFYVGNATEYTKSANDASSNNYRWVAFL